MVSDKESELRRARQENEAIKEKYEYLRREDVEARKRMEALLRKNRKESYRGLS